MCQAGQHNQSATAINSPPFSQPAVDSETLAALGRAGLSDVPCLLTPPALLSEGQKWRYRLARAMMSGRRIIFADEFCASLDRITALATAYQVRRMAERTGCMFVLAGCREDAAAELRPDVVVEAGSGRVDVKCDMSNAEGV